MFPIMNIGDTFTGDYKFCLAKVDQLSFECSPYTITFVVKDANFSLETSKRYQNILFEVTIPLFSPFVAVGVYDRCDGQGDFYEDPIDDTTQIFPGLNKIQMSKDGQKLTIKYTELYDGSLASYVAELAKS